MNGKHDLDFYVEREDTTFCARVYFTEQKKIVLVYRRGHYRDCDLLTFEVEMKLKEDKLIAFLQENLLIFSDGHKINYVALDNIDRLSNPGEVVAQFNLVRYSMNFVVRALIYQDAKNPFVITVHRMGDSTDCEKISFSSKILQL